jgi:non-specific serine/threonine protein kinase
MHYPNNLPVALSSFIGREHEVAEIQARLAAHRLLTLTGPGGCGKTRLAIRAANDLAAGFADGVWLVELAPLADAALVPQAVAAACGVREQPGRPLLDTLPDQLQFSKTLLLLDNCEHLIAACAQLAETLLQACPNLRILATSREPLGVPGEVIWPVPPLSLPEPQPWRSPTSGQDALPVYELSEAMRLFAERAAAASPAFALTPENGAWVADICRRLDGIPLAIELAAARVRALSVRQIAGRLDDRFHLLTSGSRTAPPRHQTLAAALDWSYALLTSSEQAVLQRLSAFAGGCTLEAAEYVGASGGVARGEVLDTLSNLVDKSLVTVDRFDGQRRYRLLETIRQYAREKLAAGGEAHQVRTRHLDYFLQWAESSEPHLTGPEQLAWLGRFETEHDNLRAALEWSQAQGSEAEKGLRLAAACGRFWRLRTFFSEGRRRLAAVLARPGKGKGTAVHAQALFAAALLAYLQSDYPASRELCAESLAVSRELGPAGQPGVAEALSLLGEIATEEGDYETAPALFEEALDIWRTLENKRGVGDALLQLGWAAMRTGNYEQATARLKESLILFRQAGYPADIALNLAGLGEAAVRQEQYESAARLLEESLALRREIGDKWGMGTALGSLGWAALRQRDFPRMRAMLAESIAVRLEIGDRSGIAWCLEKLAEAILIQVQVGSQPEDIKGFQQAGQLFGAAAALREPVGSVIDPADQPDYERHLAMLQAALGAEALAAAWAEGQAMPLQAVIDEALSEPERPFPSSEAAAKERFGGLTPRERETAVLIAQGKSNREIAEAMTVRVKTVETYVTRILNKLGFDSRVQIAIWAVETGLTA